MGEKLHAKLNRTTRTSRTKKALTQGEVKALLEFLGRDESLQGRENYALVYMLVTSGLRASELCALRWGDLECTDGRWIANFIGKGGRVAEQELYAPAVEAMRKCFELQLARSPSSEDALFWTIPAFNHQAPSPMTGHVLWTRVKRIESAARAAGVLSRDLQFSPHLFRRTYATLLYKSGMKRKAILTRHADIDTLCKHYVDDREEAGPYLRAAFA